MTRVPTPFQHPYLQTQVLTKLYNNITTRSNIFAVWLTVGFFEVTKPATTPPTLGAEIGRSEGRQVRHRMFAIVDRTNLNIFQTTFAGTPQAAGPPLPILVTNTTPSPQVVVTPAQQPQTVPITFASLTGFNPFTGATGAIGVGSTLVFEPGTDNEETVVLQAAPAGSPPGSAVPGDFLQEPPRRSLGHPARQPRTMDDTLRPAARSAWSCRTTASSTERRRGRKRGASRCRRAAFSRFPRKRVGLGDAARVVPAFCQTMPTHAARTPVASLAIRQTRRDNLS